VCHVVHLHLLKLHRLTTDFRRSRNRHNVCFIYAGVVEVCQTEQFEASCGRNDEMILMTSAEYGRMRVSRCVQSDYGYIGCSSDVLGILDAACSGRRQCTVGVPSAALERAAAASCPGDLKLYLAASYRCIPGNKLTTPKRPFFVILFKVNNNYSVESTVRAQTSAKAKSSREG